MRFNINIMRRMDAQEILYHLTSFSIATVGFILISINTFLTIEISKFDFWAFNISVYILSVVLFCIYILCIKKVKPLILVSDKKIHRFIMFVLLLPNIISAFVYLYISKSLFDNNHIPVNRSIDKNYKRVIIITVVLYCITLFLVGAYNITVFTRILMGPDLINPYSYILYYFIFYYLVIWNSYLCFILMKSNKENINERLFIVLVSTFPISLHSILVLSHFQSKYVNFE